MKVWLISGLSIWLSGGFLAPAQAQFCSTALPGVNRLNQVKSGNVIVIGRSPTYPYIVAVLSTDDSIVAAVRRCIPDAFKYLDMKNYLVQPPAVAVPLAKGDYRGCI